MALDINAIIIAATCFIIFGIFLFYDLFRKGEKWSYLAYITATIPTNFLWFAGYNVLAAYLILFILWDICLLRDLLFVYQKTKEYDDIFLFVLLAVVVQIVYTAIGPNMNPAMKTNTRAWLVFYFPDVYDAGFNINAWVSTGTLLGFRIAATFMVIFAILPMLIDLRDAEEHISLIALIIIDILFVVPFLWLAYIWLGGATLVLTLLFAVVLLIVLLLLTREK
jgi:hypothetical protein